MRIHRCIHIVVVLHVNVEQRRDERRSRRVLVAGSLRRLLDRVRHELGLGTIARVSYYHMICHIT